MIVSHRHRFIFLKTRKTAGTSIEIALSRHCGPDDIITRLAAQDEELRCEWGGKGPQNQERAYNHMPAHEVVDLVGRDVWDDYFKFTVERNPWDAVVSAWFWGYRDREAIPIGDFIQSLRPKKQRGMRRLLRAHLAGSAPGAGQASRVKGVARNPLTYRLDGEVAVDMVCRYEQLAEDLQEAWRRIDLPGSPELPRAKGQIRHDRRPYREFYTPADVERVRELFAGTVQTMGYVF